LKKSHTKTLMVILTLSLAACGTLGSGTSEVEAKTNVAAVVADKSVKSDQKIKAKKIVVNGDQVGTTVTNDTGVPWQAILVIAFLVGIILPSPFVSYNMRAIAVYAGIALLCGGLLLYSAKADALEFRPGKSAYNLDLALLRKLHELEAELGYELMVTSAYRRPNHPIEAAKATPGTHAQRIAVDVACDTNCNTIYKRAQKVGFNGIGVYDKHLHLDIRTYRARWRGKSK